LNAGIGILGTILQARQHDWNWLMSVNLRGVTLGLKTFLPMVRDNRDGGYLCATASMGGLVVADDGGIYSSAKFGVVVSWKACGRSWRRTHWRHSAVSAGVNTNIHDHGSMRPPIFRFGSGDDFEQQTMAQMARSMLAMGADPMQVGEWLVEAMLANEPYVFTDGAVASILQVRRDALLAAVR
jgi:NAD(P)-dependent dehydrogenase (short-subunit alcohol dehydrogenase family)